MYYTVAKSTYKLLGHPPPLCVSDPCICVLHCASRAISQDAEDHPSVNTTQSFGKPLVS